MPTIDATADAPKRWAVCDWGAIRGLARTAPLASDLAWVLSDHTFMEPADNRDNPEGLVSKLRHALEQPGLASRALIAKPWGEIVVNEADPTRRTRRADIVDHAATLRLRAAFDRGDAWYDRVLEGRNSIYFENYRGAKHRFVTACNAFADAPKNRQTALHAAVRSGQSLEEVMRRPSLVNEVLRETSQNPLHYGRTWRRRLNVFPDRLAIGRWSRLVAYYALLRVQQRDRRDELFSNNFEDAAYAFLSSYAGCLATNDNGLTECVRVLFPWVIRVPLG